MFASVAKVRIPQATKSPVILQRLPANTLPNNVSTKINTKWNLNTTLIHNPLTFPTTALRYYSSPNNTIPQAQNQIQNASVNPTPPPFDPASIEPRSAATLKEVIQQQPALLTEPRPRITSEPNLDALIQNLEKNITPIVDSPSTIAGGHGFFSPIGWGMDFVNMIHTTTGLPWWLTIVASTLALRTMLLPIMIESHKHIARVNRVAPIIADLANRSRAAAAAGKHLVSRQLQQEIYATYRQHNANPFKNIAWALLQIPPTIVLFFAMREMALTFESFHTGGISFFTDLAVNDPLMRLNIASALTFIFGFELNAKDMPNSFMKKAMRVGFALFAVFIVFWTQYFPQCVHLYWLVNSTTTIGIQYVLRRVKPVRRFLGIPDLLPSAPVPGLTEMAKASAEPPTKLFLANKPKPTPGTSPMGKKKEQQVTKAEENKK